MTKMTLLEEFRHRINSCREGTNEGYGEIRSLRNFMGAARVRLKEITTFVDAAKDIEDPEIQEMVRTEDEDGKKIKALMEEANAGLPENGGKFKGQTWE